MDGQSEAVFEEFVLGRQAALFRTAFLLTGDRGHAEDLLQGALERTYQLVLRYFEELSEAEAAAVMRRPGGAGPGEAAGGDQP